MGGLGGWLSPVLTATSNVVGAYQGAQADEKERETKRAALQLQQLRQQHNDEIANALKQAQTSVATRTAAAPIVGSPEYIAQKRAEAAAGVEGATPGLVARDDALRPGKVADAAALIPTKVAEQNALTPGAVKRAGDVANAEVPAKIAAQPPQLVTGTAPDGTPTYGVFNKGSRSIERVDDAGMTPKVAGAGGQTSAQAALAMQRLGMSLADVKAAHDRMTAAENDPEFRKLLTTMNQAEMNTADVKPDSHAHGLMGALNNAGGSLVTGAAQSHLDPRLNTYRRDKETVGTALTEVLPRPNQQLLQIEKGLSGIDAGWNPELTSAAQARRAQGIEQLQGALSALQAGRSGTVGHAATAPTAVTGAPAPLSTADRVRAAADPKFAAWLRSQGMMP